MKVPAGGVAWPLSSAPQQARVPAALTAQAWWLPTVTAVNVARGWRRVAHVVVAPAGERAVVLDGAGDVRPSVDRGAGKGARGRGGLAVGVVPQQATVPRVVTAQV